MRFWIRTGDYRVEDSEENGLFDEELREKSLYWDFSDNYDMATELSNSLRKLHGLPKYDYESQRKYHISK